MMSVIITPHSGLDFPKIFRTEDVIVPVPSVDIFHKLIEINGRGILYRISCYQSRSTNSQYDVRITIDGNVHIVDLSQAFRTRGLGGDDSLYGSRSDHMDFLPIIRFDYQLKIEMRGNDTTKEFFVSIDYGLF